MGYCALHSVADVGLAGLQHALDAANALPPAPPAFRHMIDPACYEHFRLNSALACTGRVKAHCDDDFPRWATVLFLRSGDGATLKVLGADPVPIHPGLAVTFDAHRRHSVQQGLNDVLVWLPVCDRDEPMPAGEALAKAVRRFAPRLSHLEESVS